MHDAYDTLRTRSQRVELECERLLCAVGPFDVLDVDRDADDKTVEAQYRDIAKLVHPDKGGSDEAFRRLHEAFESLSTQAGRTEQDRVLHRSSHTLV